MKCRRTVGAGPRACPFFSSAECSGRTQEFIFRRGTARRSPTGGLTAFLFIFLLTMIPAAISADQVTAPLADPAQKSQQQQEQTANGSENATLPTLTESQLYDIREPILIPDSNRFLWWIAAILLGLLLLGLLFYFWKKQTCQQRAVLAYETALRDLERAGPLIEEQNINAFITLIDQTLRRYIEQRFGIFARRQTTREFIRELAEDRENVPRALMNNSENLKTWLRHCDLVKFAKAGLSQEAMTDMLSNLRTFIASTKMEAEEK